MPRSYMTDIDELSGYKRVLGADIFRAPGIQH